MIQADDTLKATEVVLCCYQVSFQYKFFVFDFQFQGKVHCHGNQNKERQTADE